MIYLKGARGRSQTILLDLRRGIHHSRHDITTYYGTYVVARTYESSYLDEPVVHCEHSHERAARSVRHLL